MWSGSCKLAVVLAAAGVAMPLARAAETQSPPQMSTTQLVIQLGTDDAVPVRSRFQPSPPAILVEFPHGLVTGVLPERSAVRRGVVEEIQTLYGMSKPGQGRWIQGLKVLLRGPYDYEVRAERGRVFIEISHPASIGREQMELGRHGAIIAGAMPMAITERFEAMQDALNRARPKSFTWRAGSLETAGSAPAPQPLRLTLPNKTSRAVAAVRQTPRKRAPAKADPLAAWMWALGVLGLAGIGGSYALWARRMRPIQLSRQPSPSVPSGIRIIDQLAWRAFERQGYQLLHMVELGEPLGLMRVTVKDGAKTALLCVGNGTFFEKTTVEQFLRSMRKAGIEHGILIAPGSFTVPAQRCAKEHGVVLIGREQLTQLLSDGAINEHYIKQVQHLHKQLEDTQEALTASDQQLDAMRRQRNEASWLLGEERAKTSQLDAQVHELANQLNEAKAAAAQLQQTAETSRKQWEESQWYLGEARASAQHLDEQLRALHGSHLQLQDEVRELTQQVTQLERQRQEAAQQPDAPAEPDRAPLRDIGERRRAPRRFHPDITVEILQPDGSRIFEGIPQNISRTGLGFETDALPSGPEDRVNVRLYLPETVAPVEAAARLVWQRRPEQLNGHQRHQTGCEFLDIPVEGRSIFEAILAKSTT